MKQIIVGYISIALLAGVFGFIVANKDMSPEIKEPTQSEWQPVIEALETMETIEDARDCYYKLEPKEDITAWELALLLKYKGKLHDTLKTELPPAALRHLEEVCE